MKNLKRVFLLLTIACAAMSIVDAATVTSYSASDSPGSAPDGNSGTADVWTVTGDDGANRSFLQGVQDGNSDLWAIWDMGGDGGTYATHTFDGGALAVGQSVSIDLAHNINIDSNMSIGIRLLDGPNSEAELVFQGGKLIFSRYDTASGVYLDTTKYYDRYDLFQVVFTLTDTNSYAMSVSEGSIVDNPTGLGNDADDGNPAVGEVVDSWTGSFTGSAITGIQIYTEGGNSSDQWFDNLTINEDWLATPRTPLPTLEQENVTVSGLALSWSVPEVRSLADPNVFVVDPNLVSFNLYYNDVDPNLAAVSPVSVTGWDAETLRASHVPSPDLIKNSTCYWRVDCVLDDGSEIQGDAWFFYTELTKPIITSGPDHQIVDAGATAVFSVVVDSQSPALYKWYQYVDGTSDTMLSDGGDISGATTDTLSIDNVEVGDEDDYYCVVKNDSGVSVPSELVPLGVKRKIAYWPFDGKVVDSIIPGSPVSVMEGEPNFVTAGIVGDAMEFDDGVDMLYTEPNKASYFDICDYEMTVACWVKTTDDQNWCPLVARNGEGQGWQVRQSGFTEDRPCFTTRGTGNDDGTPANRPIYDGQWHYVVATFDGIVKKIYIDGVVSSLYSSDDGSLLRDGDAVTSPMNYSQSPVAIAGRVAGNIVDGLDVQTWSIIAGVYDEVEIYNYALDEATIAQTYADLTGTNICLLQTYDLDDDCIVNLNDFGLLASEWLNSELVLPTP